MSNQYYIHQMRHFMAHLMRCQPGLLTSLSPDEGPEPFQDVEDWAARLPHRRLVHLCIRLVEQAVSTLEGTFPLAYEVLRVMLALPGEWDLDDAICMTQSSESDAAPGRRDEILLALEELMHRGLVVSGKEALRFILPFPVRFCLRDNEVMDAEERERVKSRLVRYFSSKALEEEAADPSLRSSWRLTNLLHGFKTAVEWLEELTGETVTRLLKEPSGEEVPRELAEALADFGKAMGPTVARRRSDQGWRWLMGAAVGASALGLASLEADLFRFLGHYFRQSDQMPEAVECLGHARRLYQQLPDPHQACLMSSALALTRKDQGLHDEALEEFEHAWVLACEHGLEAEKTSISNCAGALCLQQKNPGLARQWFMRGWAMAQKNGSSGDLAELCNNIGRALRDEGQLDESLRWFSEALRTSRSELNRPAQATALAEIAHLWEEKGDPGSAVIWLERALGLRRELSDGPGQASVLRDLARCARLNHRMTDASDYAIRARALARRHSLTQIDGDACLELAELALSRGDDRAATEAFVGALERLGPTSPPLDLSRIHLRLGLTLYRRGAIEESARHMLSAQALSRHAQQTDSLEEIDRWLGVLAGQMEPGRFESIVERVTELWEAGGLGGQSRQTPRNVRH